MRCALAGLSLLAAAALPLWAADPPAGIEVADIDPVGAPDAYAGKVERATYYVWHEDGVWHLRTRTKEHSRPFAGVIRVRGGKVTGLETKPIPPKFGKKGKPKKREVTDIGRVSPDGRSIQFSFITTGGEDGFSFTVSPPATALEFHLKTKGFDHPERILIGKDGKNPPAAVFALPAQPEAAEPAEPAA